MLLTVRVLCGRALSGGVADAEKDIVTVNASELPATVVAMVDVLADTSARNRALPVPDVEASMVEDDDNADRETVPVLVLGRLLLPA